MPIILINKHPLSAHNNINSPHKFRFKFYMQAGDQKLKYNLEWPYADTHIYAYLLENTSLPSLECLCNKVNTCYCGMINDLRQYLEHL